MTPTTRAPRGASYPVAPGGWHGADTVVALRAARPAPASAVIDAAPSAGGGIGAGASVLPAVFDGADHSRGESFSVTGGADGRCYTDDHAETTRGGDQYARQDHHGAGEPAGLSDATGRREGGRVPLDDGRSSYADPTGRRPDDQRRLRVASVQGRTGDGRDAARVSPGGLTSSYKPVYWGPVTTKRGRAAQRTPTRPLTLKGDSPVNASAQDTTPATSDAALAERWVSGNPTGAEFTLAEYAALYDAAQTDARIDRDEVTAIAYALYGGAIYHAAPWTCPTCRGCRTVETRNVVGSWADWNGPQLDIGDEPCPTCCDGYAAEYAAAVAL